MGREGKLKMDMSGEPQITVLQVTQVLNSANHGRYLALQDFSRYIVAATLVPVLDQVEGGGVVLDILAAGVWNVMDVDNLELVGKSPDFFRKSPPRCI